MQTQSAAKSETTLKTRFGEVAADVTKAIEFPNGILGMPNQKSFVISAMPDKKMDRFQLLQSLDDSDVSFAVISLETVGNLIDAEHLEEIRNVLEMKKADFLTMLIVSIQKTPSGAKLSVNLRAPLFIDSSNKQGYQLVLANSKYPVQHYLG